MSGLVRLRRWRSALLSVGGVVTSLTLAAAVAGPAVAENSGFWYGADSGGPGPSDSSGPPWHEPSCGPGRMYGGYVGKIGGADLVSGSNPRGYGPGHTFAWVTADAVAANAGHFRSSPPKAVGAGGYWFMHGPGNTDGTGLGPRAWGKQQAMWALADWKRWAGTGNRLPLKVLWMDVEVPGSYGWGNHHARNREVFDAFWDYISAAGAGISPGVYSTRYQWNTIMNGHTGIPHTWEWTAQVSRSNSPSPCPGSFWESSSFHADFFGGQGTRSARSAMWQWSLGTADYDQIDNNKALPR